MTSAVPAQQPPAEVPHYDETVDVTLVTTTFYVVDAGGKPVRDLRQDEVEVTVAGKPAQIAHFEPVGAELAADAAAPAAPKTAPSPAAPSPARGAAGPRHVFFFFDLTFSLPRALPAAKKVADGLVEKLPPSDFLYLVTYHSQRGMNQELGPVTDAAGRQALVQRIDAMTPNVERIHRRVDLPNYHGLGKRSDGGLMADTYTRAHDNELDAYAAEGAALAQSLQSFSAFLRQVPGPKAVLYFTQGIDSDVYGGLAAGVDLGGHGAIRHGSLRAVFDPALKALAETGAALFFVDPVVGFEPGDRVEGVEPDAEAHWVDDAPTGGGTLQLMSETSGGLVLTDPNTATLQDKLGGWLDSRYELGVYVTAEQLGKPLQAEIRVKRPGVHAWTARWLQPPRSPRELQPPERAFLAVQMTMAKDPRSALRNLVTPALEGFAGTPHFDRQGEAMHLRFVPGDWSTEMALRGMELFSVVVAPGEPPQLVSLEKRMFSPTPMHDPIEASVAAKPALVWGLVAFDLTTGQIYYGRYAMPASGG
ncbi:MAG TPA: hypothetical protein VGS57_15670 [Thermoanaerobaculia bacterium]|nr:hypothetical protein [Thermoanaerobaculia bacterium]